MGTVIEKEKCAMDVTEELFREPLADLRTDIMEGNVTFPQALPRRIPLER